MADIKIDIKVTDNSGYEGMSSAERNAWYREQEQEKEKSIKAKEEEIRWANTLEPVSYECPKCKADIHCRLKNDRLEVAGGECSQCGQAWKIEIAPNLDRNLNHAREYKITFDVTAELRKKQQQEQHKKIDDYRKEIDEKEKKAAEEYGKYVDGFKIRHDKTLFGWAYPHRSFAEIPDCVSIIGESAFAYKQNLTDVRLPASIIKIQARAFAGSRHLRSIFIPDSVVEMGEAVFLEWGKNQVICVDRSKSKLWSKKWKKGCKAKIEYR